MSIKYRWSVPPSLIAQYGAPPTVDFKATCKLHDDRAADVMRRVWAYDPESRPQARDLADALESMFKQKPVSQVFASLCSSLRQTSALSQIFGGSLPRC